MMNTFKPVNYRMFSKKKNVMFVVNPTKFRRLQRGIRKKWRWNSDVRNVGAKIGTANEEVKCGKQLWKICDWLWRMAGRPRTRKTIYQIFVAKIDQPIGPVTSPDGFQLAFKNKLLERNYWATGQLPWPPVFTVPKLWTTSKTWYDLLNVQTCCIQINSPTHQAVESKYLSRNIDYLTSLMCEHVALMFINNGKKAAYILRRHYTCAACWVMNTHWVVGE